MNASQAAGPPPALSAIGHLLKRLRVAANLTQGELAERAGVSERLISDYERGTIHRPRRDTVQLLADALELTGSERDQFVEVARGRSKASLEQATNRPQSLDETPVPLTGLIGRDAALFTTSAMLSQAGTRMLTLTGPGGVGKTRLAIELASRMGGHFVDGVCFVELAPVREPDLVISTIASALGVNATNAQPLARRLADVLRHQRMLIVLDNVEHLLDAAAGIAELLSRCDRLTMLATSRAPLRIREEKVFTVEPLVVPDLGRIPSLDELREIPAVELLVARAIAADTGFDLTLDNASAIAGLTVRLDGLPLAIELAASRLLVLTPQELLTRLERRLSMLTGGPRDLPDRLRGLRSAIDWSYGLLTADQQCVFRCVSVFVGGFTLEAAEATCCLACQRRTAHVRGEASSVFNGSILDHLEMLVRGSLLRAIDINGHCRRFTMLETIREFGLEQLEEAGELRLARHAHATWCAAYVDRAEPMKIGPEATTFLDLLEAELDNIRSALAWAIDNNDADLAVRMCAVCYYFWYVRGHYEEGRRLLERSLNLEDAVEPAVMAPALVGLGLIAMCQGDYGRTSVLETALELYRELDDMAGVAASLAYLGKAAHAQGENDRASSLYDEARSIYERLDDPTRAGVMALNLGVVAYDQGDFARSLDLLQNALTLNRANGQWNSVALTLNHLALVALAHGNHDRAVAAQMEAFEHWRRMGNKEGIALCLEHFAQIAAANQEPLRTVRLLACADALRSVIGAPGRQTERARNLQLICNARNMIGESSFEREWADYRALSTDDAIEFALEIESERRSGHRPSRSARVVDG